MSSLLSHVKKQLTVEISSQDVESVWTGFRPLVQSLYAKDTASIVRDHFIETSSSGLVTIAGGKWTTFRRMSEDVLSQTLGQSQVSTADLRLIGYQGYSSELSAELEVSIDIANHLVSSYGGLSKEILLYGCNERLVEGYPYLVSEVYWAIDRELAQKPLDILARRTRLATLDAKAAKEALPKVIAIMEEKLHWSSFKAEEEKQKALIEIEGYVAKSYVSDSER